MRASLLKNTIALAIPNILNPFISFVLILAISRALGVEGLGEYSLVLAYNGIFATLASLGLADLIVRELAKDPRKLHLYLFNAGLFGSVSSLVFVIVMNLFVYFMNYSTEILYANAICSLSLVFSTAIAYMEAIFRSLEKSKYIAFTFLAENALRVAACVILLYNGYGIAPLFGVVLATRIFATILLGFFYKTVAGTAVLRVDKDILTLLAKESPTFTSIAIFSTIYLSIDQILLSKLKSIESVGIYSAADRLLTMCKTLPVAFSSALLPHFAREYLNGSEKMQGYIEKSLSYLCLLLLPTVVGTVVLADDFIRTIYGEKFITAGHVLRIHIISLIPFSMVVVLAQGLIATNNQRADLSINIVAAVANFVLCMAFIPYLAEMGAVLATLCAMVLFNQLQYIYFKKYLFRVSFYRIIRKALIPSVCMGFVTYFTKDWNLILSIGLSVLAYCALLFATKSVTIEDLVNFVGSIRESK
jgi:O-antigen/teichoic acid export membrane protein